MRGEDWVQELVGHLLSYWKDFWDAHIGRWERRRYEYMDPDDVGDVTLASKTVLQDFRGWFADEMRELSQMWDKHPEIKRGYTDDYGLEDATVLQTVCVAADMAAQKLCSDYPPPNFDQALQIIDTVAFDRRTMENLRKLLREQRGRGHE